MTSRGFEIDILSHLQGCAAARGVGTFCVSQDVLAGWKTAHDDEVERFRAAVYDVCIARRIQPADVMKAFHQRYE